MLMAVVVSFLVTGTVCAQGLPVIDIPYKWSQPVDVETGWDVLSIVVPMLDDGGDNVPIYGIPVADDWKCPDGEPVRVVDILGYYPFVPPGGVNMERP